MSLSALPFPRAGRPPAERTTRSPERAERATGKRFAALFSIVVLAVVASPIVENWRPTPRDDFPLSYYRMFSEERDDVQRVTYLVGIDRQGHRFTLPYQLVGPGGMNQVRRQIHRLVERGDAPRLCRTVAGRVARAGSRLADLRTVEVTTGTFRLSAYFTGQQSAPDVENVRARCTVERAQP
jgi:hypothetical protein